MSRNGQGARARPGDAIARPILWSAAGHALALSACVLLAAGRGPEARPLTVVEVLLVPGEPAAGAAAPPGTARPASPRRANGHPAAPGMPDVPGSRAGERPSVAAERPAPAASAPPAATDAGSAPGAAQPPPAPSPVARVEAEIATPAGADGGAAPSVAVARQAGGGAEAPGDRAPAGSGGAARSATGIAGAGPPAGDGDAGGGPEGTAGLLRERIQSRIVYPKEAVRRGLEGEVLLRIHVATGGVPNEVRIARSSGARLLDDAARRGVVSAAPLPSAPGWVEVPVRFRLR